jgi:RimJ/RimL family protein N-acetyltransferase
LRDAINNPVFVRSAIPADAALLDAWRKEPSATRFQPLPDLSLENLRQQLDNFENLSLLLGGVGRFTWIVIWRGQPAGWIALDSKSPPAPGWLSFGLSSSCQGHGVMAAALAQWCEELDMLVPASALQAACHQDNVAAWKTLERTEFHFVQTLNAEWNGVAATLRCYERQNYERRASSSLMETDLDSINCSTTEMENGSANTATDR